MLSLIRKFWSSSVSCEQLKILVKLDYPLKKIKTEETHFVDFVSYFLAPEKS